VPYRSIAVKRQQEHQTEMAALNRLFPTAEVAIREMLNEYVNEWLLQHQNKPTAAFSSSWIPGPDWNDGTGVYGQIDGGVAKGTKRTQSLAGSRGIRCKAQPAADTIGGEKESHGV
jgi:hypothetical protein